MKEIELTKGMRCKVDDEDFVELSKYKWCVSKSSCAYYAVRGEWQPKTKNTKVFYMHRLIVRAIEGMQVDHINGDTLDNQKSNLRICQAFENQRNMRPRASGTKGIHFNKRRAHMKTPWHAYITVNRKRNHIGYFETEKEAQDAYNQEAKRLFGEFASVVELRSPEVQA